MNKDDFLRGMEQPTFLCVESLFEDANLTPQEQSVFRKYMKYCEYWLLRVKKKDVHFAARVARGLINLQSGRVSGERVKFVREMFPQKRIHKIIEDDRGIRSEQATGSVGNKYFELKILSFLLTQGFDIKLAKSKNRGQRIAEFAASKNSTTVHVEAKNLNLDRLEDQIFGRFVDPDQTIPERRKSGRLEIGYENIAATVERNYNDAIDKFEKSIEPGHFIIFMSTHLRSRYLGSPAISYLNSLPGTWDDAPVKYQGFCGVVLPFQDETVFLRNPRASLNLAGLIPGLKHFHEYEPEVIPELKGLLFE